MAHPWFRPLYRRVLTLAVCLAWFGFELRTGEILWLLLSAALSGYAIWEFFLSGNYPMTRDDAG